jgi:cyclase
MSSMGKVADPYVEDLGGGVFAYIQPDGSWFLNNTGIVTGAASTVLIDQCGTEDRGRAFLAAAAARSRGPLHTLVNTHHHGDHTFGNAVMPPGTAIVGHSACRREVVATGTAITALFHGPEWGEIGVRPPNVTFEDRLTLWVDELELQLIHFGTPAHTTNDVVVWIPEHSVAFTGDLVFNGSTPFALQGSVAGWIETCNRLAALGAQTLVPGHGPVAGPDAIGEVRAYLELVMDTARTGLAAGVTPLDAAKELDLAAFAELTDPERIVGNLHRAYHELNGAPRGAPLDLVPIAGEMMAYHGGPIISHA